MRYAMQVNNDPVSQALLSIFNINRETAYVELHEDELVVKEGLLFDHSFPISNLGRAHLDQWQWYMGLGVHTDFQGTVAPLTSTKKVVAISLSMPQQLFLPLMRPLGLEVECKRLMFSVADADSFLIAFNAMHAQSPSAEAGEWEDKVSIEE